ncbi:LysR family transcriptional regulator [Marinitenerispora sediminis]|uniref:LysR family transcriptional regulator n=1 Tax=Marinitenerispora sediminis TaxID=1931232 RepID=A0A368T7E4_9ACTN|nr:LysR family transcriptional regulator [Marinitenerispora sediminis]RCV50862.1 LysR family transcriptional regulator [Marinitenerispora sediminis]RCV56485.1 LysR family transcriptional regulator [Marinitenerispora sediminis]RCV59568.1 LysR family transcriptional regulator [Marinitenerispora sediminis]
MLDLDRLRALNAVAEYGSVSAAADVLGITTSAVSQQIAKLERETASRLLERSGRGVRLTDAAHLLVRHAERILAQVAEAEADLEAQRGSVVGRLSVAAFPTAARGIMPRVLSDVAVRHPQLTTRLFEADPKVALPQVQRGEYDLAIVHDWADSPLPIPDGLEKAPLVDDPAEIVLPEGHPLAGEPSLELAALAEERWISAPPGDICQVWLTQSLRRSGVEPEIVHYSAEYPTQLALVAAGLGIAILPRLGRGILPPAVVTVPVRPVLMRHLYVVWRAEASRRPAVQAVVAAMRAAVATVEEARLANASSAASRTDSAK